MLCLVRCVALGAQTRALEDVVLQMKAMRIENVEAFPFPSAPDPAALRAAVTLLVNLGALSVGIESFRPEKIQGL